MEKPEVEHLSNDEKSIGPRVVDKFPPEARAEAGVLLNIERAEGTSLRLAEDGHASLLVRKLHCLLTVGPLRPYFYPSLQTIPTIP